MVNRDLQKLRDRKLRLISTTQLKIGSVTNGVKLLRCHMEVTIGNCGVTRRGAHRGSEEEGGAKLDFKPPEN